MLRRLTKHLKYAVVYFPVDDTVSRIATKDVVMVEGGGEMKKKSNVFVLVKRGSGPFGGMDSAFSSSDSSISIRSSWCNSSFVNLKNFSSA